MILSQNLLPLVQYLFPKIVGILEPPLGSICHCQVCHTHECVWMILSQDLLPLVQHHLPQICHGLVVGHRLRAGLEQSERVEARGSGEDNVNVGPAGQRLL